MFLKNNFLAKIAFITTFTLTGCQTFSHSETIGTYNNQTIQSTDLTATERLAILNAKKQVYETEKQILEKRYLDDWFTKYKTDNELKSLTDAKNDYFNKNMSITDDKVNDFIKKYENNKQLQAIQSDKRATVVKEFLTKQEKLNLQNKLIKEAYDAGKIKLEDYIPPSHFLIDFNINLGHAYNSSLNYPKVTLVEFSDYQCPYCVKAHTEIKKFMEKNKEKVQFIYVDFPLSELHPLALPAALAAKCAEYQGKYWGMHDLIFDRAPTEPLKEEMLNSFPEKLNLDMAKYKECLERPSEKEAILKDKTEGTRVGVNSTPTIFINGELFNSEITFDNLNNAVSKLMK